ncbi:hypothetical protein [Bradyrhizobium diazoefficiens]|uniref:hypothetical protein n=1 Tax=Bradyrhizobium diazoefficiens TaxID=1355477 RepID=UPI000D729408|nr:hypothetical protein [Bradyrhizobium diazoefficiens]AWO90833.1 hypothetical protein DI395_21630 [Bradyrhizobium diazoefficiens]
MMLQQKEINMFTLTEHGAIWLAGHLDGFGEIVWDSGAPAVKFKSAFMDRIEAIESITPGGPESRPFKISGHSKRPQRILVFKGTDFVLLENALSKHMLTGKRKLLARLRDRWINDLKERALKRKQQDAAGKIDAPPSAGAGV